MHHVTNPILKNQHNAKVVIGVTANTSGEWEVPHVPEAPDNSFPKETGTDAFLAFAEEQLADIDHTPWQYRLFQLGWFAVATGLVFILSMIVGAAIIMMGGTP